MQLRPTENVAEHAVVSWAEKQGIEQTKLNLMGNRGWPDRCFWLSCGRPVVIEFKRLGEEPRKLQIAKIKTLKRLGYDVHCVDRKEEGIRILQNAIRSRQEISALARNITAKLAPKIKRVTKILLGAKGSNHKLVAPDGKHTGRSCKTGSVAAKATSQNRTSVLVRAGVRRAAG